MKDDFKIAGVAVKRGETKSITLPIAKLYDFTDLGIPVHVIRGKNPGPTLFICAALHGDEINGVEIIRRLIHNKALTKLNGTLIAIPVVNIFGFNTKSRYLPDRRDLNRFFPGSPTGSLASRIAHTFMKEIVAKCTHGIDLHTGTSHRTNMPQIRANLNNKKTREFAKAFHAPILIHSAVKDGSLREATHNKGVTTILFEGGEALRFDESVIQIGVAGCLSAMRNIGMLQDGPHTSRPHVLIAKDSYWIRAPRSGMTNLLKKPGDSVKKNELIATIHDLLGTTTVDIKAEAAGHIIGINRLPLITQGEALAHVATSKNLDRSRFKHLNIYDFYTQSGVL